MMLTDDKAGREAVEVLANKVEDAVEGVLVLLATVAAFKPGPSCPSCNKIASWCCGPAVGFGPFVRAATCRSCFTCRSENVARSDAKAVATQFDEARNLSATALWAL